MNTKLYRATRNILINIENACAKTREKLEERQLEIATRALEGLREGFRNKEYGYVFLDDKQNNKEA